MTSLVSYKLGKQLSSVYQDESLHFENELQPVSRRLDEIAPSSAQLASESFQYNAPKSFMNLRLKKTEQYTVVLRTTTSQMALDGSNTLTCTNAAPLNESNFFPTPFGISKSISNVRIAAGKTILEETQDERNPWLIECKSAQFDREACMEEGHVPLCDSGIGNFNLIVGQGAIRPVEQLDAAPPNNLWPLKSSYINAQSQYKQITNRMLKRWRIVGTPTMKGADGTPMTAIQTETDSSSTDWVPSPNGLGTNVFYGEVIATYVIEVEEYIVGRFLTTPYQNNNICKSIQIAPNNYAMIAFNYDSNYINNGLFNWVPPISTLGGAAADAATSYMSVVRIPSGSKLEIESFDVLRPPQTDATLKMLNWRPVRVQDVPLISNLAFPGTSSTTAQFNQESIIAKYCLISALPELWNGSLNGVLISNSMGPYNVSKFLPAQITACTITIGQETITENIPFKELVRMTKELTNNPDVKDQISMEKIYQVYNNDGTWNASLGVPYLLLDLEKLSMRSGTFQQYLANVQYPTVQNVKISFTVASRDFNPTGWNDGDDEVFPTNPITYTPYIYMFYPHVLIQKLDGSITNNQLVWDLSTVDRALEMTTVADNYRALTLTGGGWFSDVKDYLKDNYQKVIKGLVSGIRKGEEFTRDDDNWQNVNKALKYASEGAKIFGYGKRAGAGSNIR